MNENESFYDWVIRMMANIDETIRRIHELRAQFNALHEVKS